LCGLDDPLQQFPDLLALDASGCCPFSVVDGSAQDEDLVP
jgi:hypothetical protein